MSLFNYLKEKYGEEKAHVLLHFVLGGEFNYLTEEEFDYIAEFYGGKKQLAAKFAQR